MNVREQLASDMAAAIAVYGETFEHGGEVYACVRRDSPTAMDLQEAGGLIDEVSYWLVVAKSVFASESVWPVNGDAVNNGRHQVKLVSGHKNAAAVSLVLHIGSFDA